jgi:hypothetical protein
MPYGYYVTKVATAHTYTNTTRTFVYLDYDDSRTITIVGASVTRSTYLVFAEMAAGATEPSVPVGTVSLMQVDASGGTLSAVTDLRPGGEIAVDCYLSISDAVSRALTNTTLVLNSRAVVDADLVIANLAVETGGYLLPATGVTVTVTNVVRQSMTKWIGGAGTVVFGSGSVKEIIPQWWGAVADGTTDSTIALKAWAAALSNNGTVPIAGRLPSGNYLTTDTITLTNLYRATIYFDGKIVGNIDKPILTLTTVQWLDLYGLKLENIAVTSNARCLSGTAVYTASFRGGKLLGGYYGVDVQGNDLHFDGMNIRGAAGAGFRARSGGNNASNSIRNCAIESNTGAAYGGLYFDSSISATTYNWTVSGNYFEGNGAQNVNISNGFMVDLYDNYFALDDTTTIGVLLSGTYTNCYVTARNNHFTDITGTGSKIGFKQDNTAYMRLMKYYSNIPNDATKVDVYGQCPYGINLEASGYATNIANADFSTIVGVAGSAPTLWTKSGGSDAMTTTTISQYGGGLAAVKETGTYLYQNIVVRPYTLYRLSAWMSQDAGITSNRLQLYNTARSTKFGEVVKTTADVEQKTVYWNSGANTAAAIMLNVYAGTGYGYFSGLKMVDLTN